MKKDSLPSFLKKATKTAQTLKDVVTTGAQMIDKDKISQGLEKGSKGVEIAAKGARTVAKTMEKASENLKKLSHKLKDK